MRIDWRVLAVPLAGWLLAAAAEAQPVAGGVRAHYIVFETGPGGDVTPVHHQYVRLAALPQAREERDLEARLAEARAAEPQAMGVAVRVTDAGGRVVFRDFVEVAAEVRAEFGHDAQGRPLPEVDAYRFPLERTAFVVRSPVVPGGVLHLQHSAAAEAASFDLARTEGLSASGLPRTTAATDIVTSGSPANRVDLLIVGDGYVAGESAAFTTQAANVANGFLSGSPYADYRNFVNVRALFVASNQSEADHPPYNASCPLGNKTCCPDPAATSDPKAGTFVDTAFDAAYCSFGVQRSLSINVTKVMVAAVAEPDWDKIAVVVNDVTYGGSGGSVWTTSAHPQAVGVGQHEHGHSFTGLADEYDTFIPSYPGCSDLGAGPACEPNVTDQTSRAQVKWTAWIADSTPVPTPSDMAGVIGLFQGARYSPTTHYRPKQNCIMRTLGAPFCDVCSEAYVRRLYRGGWGVPAEGIDPIEPGTEQPTPGTVNSVVGQPVTFSATILQPQAGPTVAIEWLVDGVPTGAAGSSFTFTPTSTATRTVTLRVTDRTSLVKATAGAPFPQKTRTWTVVTGLPGLTIDDRTVAEDACENAAFRVYLSAPTDQTVTVTYTTSNGTALAGSDYTATTGTLTFTPNRRYHSFYVPILADPAVEPTETFTVTLSNPVGATLARAQATGTIHPTPPPAIVPVYRAYNFTSFAHFFTTSLGEYDNAVANGFRGERVAFRAHNTHVAGTTALFRMYNPNPTTVPGGGRHYYTLSAGERDSLMGGGLLYENDEAFCYTSPQPGTVEVFRMYNRISGTHLYTTNVAERDHLLANFPGVWELHASLCWAFP